MLVKNVSSESYVDVMSSDFQVVEVAASDVKTEFGGVIAWTGCIDCCAAHESINRHHISDVEFLDRRMRICRINVVTLVEASANFAICSVKRKEAINAKLSDTAKAMAACNGQRSGCLRFNDPLPWSSNPAANAKSVGLIEVHIVPLNTRALGLYFQFRARKLLCLPR